MLMNWLTESWWVGISALAGIISVFIALYQLKRRNRLKKQPYKSSDVSIGRDNLGPVVVGDISGQVSITTTPSRKTAQLSIVDILLSEGDYTLNLDIKVRNNSDEVIFLKKARINILDYISIPEPAMPSAVPASFSYDAQLPVRGNAEINISQVVKPNDVDRFIFKVSGEGEYPFLGLFLYYFSIDLIFNEDNRVVSPKRILAHVPSCMEIRGLCVHPPDHSWLEEAKEAGIRALKIVKEDEEVLVDQELVEAIRSYAEITI